MMLDKGFENKKGVYTHSMKSTKVKKEILWDSKGSNHGKRKTTGIDIKVKM